MELFKETPGQEFSGGHPAYSAIRNAAQRIKDLLPPRLARATVKSSVGQGNWAKIPWIAVLHPEVTRSTQEGVYPVLLFHPSMENVEITIAQGVTRLKQTLGRPEAYNRLQERAIALRGELGALLGDGFLADSDYDLGSATLGDDYVISTIVHRRFDLRSLPTSDVSRTVSVVLDAYADLVDSGRYLTMTNLTWASRRPSLSMWVKVRERISHPAVVTAGGDRRTVPAAWR